MTMSLNPTLDKSQTILKNLGPLLSAGAQQRLQQLGVPTSKKEDWRYSSLASFVPQSVFIKSSPKLGAGPFELLENYPQRLVFCGGVLNKELSQLPAGITFESGSSTSGAQDFIGTLSEGLSLEHLKIKVAANHSFADSLALIHLPPFRENTSNVEGISLEIEIDQASKLEIVEIQLTPMTTPEEPAPPSLWRNQKTHLKLAPNSNLSFVKLSCTLESDLSLSTLTAEVSEHATFVHTLVNLGGKLTRSDVTINLRASGAHGAVRSLAALKQNEQADLNALIYHAAPHTTSAQLVKNILDGKSRGVFTGKIYIEREAIGVDSSQLSRALILSNKAQMNARPQLEIYADDVKAGHGATIGQLSDEELFYLQSRGLSAQKAKEMLCHGFGLEIIQEVQSPAAKALIEANIFDQFEKHSQLQMKAPL